MLSLPTHLINPKIILLFKIDFPHANFSLRLWVDKGSIVARIMDEYYGFGKTDWEAQLVLLRKECFQRDSILRKNQPGRKGFL